MKVMGRWSVKTVDVRADGTGLSSRAGTSLLALVADRVPYRTPVPTRSADEIDPAPTPGRPLRADVRR
jgi:hypothetical protein